MALGAVMQAPKWCSDFIGIPFADLGRDSDGCDCWGLVRMVLCQRCGVRVPSFATSYESEANTSAVTRSIDDARASGEWRFVVNGYEREFDVAEMVTPMRLGTKWCFSPLHVGIVVARGWLLHTERVTGSLLMRYGEPGINKRIAGFWRHKELVAAA